MEPSYQQNYHDHHHHYYHDYHVQAPVYHSYSSYWSSPGYGYSSWRRQHTEKGLQLQSSQTEK